MNDTVVPSRIVCMNYKGMRSGGFFYGESPFNYPSSVLFLQLSISALLTSLLQLLLNPLGESAFISQMLVGIVLGPSVIGRDNVIVRNVFPRNSFYVSETFAFFGCMLFMFLVGVKVDLNSVKQLGKKGLAIGLCCFFLPLLLNTSVAVLLQQTVKMDPILHESIISIAVFQSSSSFYVTTCLLTDLKLLNSELGRLAVSASMISGMLSWCGLILAFTVRQSSFRGDKALPFMVSSLCFVLILIVFLMRPIMRSMVRHTSMWRAINEKYIFYILLMVLSCAFLCEFIGQHFMLGPMVLGLVVPDGPPLGSALVNKIDSYVSLILLPGYFVFSGAAMDVSTVSMKTFGVIWLLVICSFFAKLTGAMVPSLLCKMPLVDALSLGLVISAQGITDILIWQHGMMLRLIDQQYYSIMVISTVVLTGTITPIVKKLYNPSKRYASSKGRTMEHASAHDSELRLLACVHGQENTPSLIRLLDVSNPTTKSPVCCYVVHLIPLAGRSTPLLITHRPGCRSSFHSNLSDRIINALQLFEQHNHGKVIMTAITAMAPCASMHDDVCSLALEKQACMVIIPFHFHTAAVTADNNEALTPNNPLRTVNLNILRKAPCSVGILVDRSGRAAAAVKSLSLETMYSVGVIFIEGPDDREALAYALRMAGKPNVVITVIRLVTDFTDHAKLDLDMVDKYKTFLKSSISSSSTSSAKTRHSYKEMAVKNSLEMINVIRSMDNHSYNMILVGRRHSSESPLFAGLTDWSEYPELGSIGDVLASEYNNSQFSLLVVQQHAFEEVKDYSDSPKYHVMVPMDSPKSVPDAASDHHHNLSGNKVRPVPSVSKETNRKSRGVDV